MTLSEDWQATVKRLLKRRGITQRELGRRMGVEEPRVSRMLNTDANVTLHTVARVGVALGVRFTPLAVPLGEELPDTVTWRGETYRRIT